MPAVLRRLVHTVSTATPNVDDEVSFCSVSSFELERQQNAREKSSVMSSRRVHGARRPALLRMQCVRSFCNANFFATKYM
jgi:hypothetical protein